MPSNRDSAPPSGGRCTELEHAVDLAVEALARPGLSDQDRQMPELALDVQHGSKIRFSTHADISIARH